MTVRDALEAHKDTGLMNSMLTRRAIELGYKAFEETKTHGHWWYMTGPDNYYLKFQISPNVPAENVLIEFESHLWQIFWECNPDLRTRLLIEEAKNRGINLTITLIHDVDPYGKFLGYIVEYDGIYDFFDNTDLGKEIVHFMESELLFYIRNKKETLGNCVLWCRENNSGYSYDIDQAMKATLDEAKAICAVREGKFEMFFCSDIDKLITRHVDASKIGKAITR